MLAEAWVRARRCVKGRDVGVSCASEGRLSTTGGGVRVSCGGEGRLTTTGGGMRGRCGGAASTKCLNSIMLRYEIGVT